MSETDLTSMFNDWPYEPGRINARRIIGADGKPKIQVRLDLGVLQMEMTGRPDGNKSVLTIHQKRLQRYTKENDSSSGFVLTSQDCRELRGEAVQFYHRYMALFALGEYAAVIKDIAHNLHIIDMCREFGETEEDRLVLEQFRPQMIMMGVRSEAERSLKAGQSKDAIRVLDHGLEQLRICYEEIGRGDEFENANEAQLLRGMRDALVPKLPSSQRVELQERLQSAIDAENYELAAILRDELRLLG